MLAAAHGVEVGEHRDVIQHLIERGGINAVAEQVSMGTVYNPKGCLYNSISIAGLLLLLAVPSTLLVAMCYHNYATGNNQVIFSVFQSANYSGSLL